MVPVAALGLVPRAHSHACRGVSTRVATRSPPDPTEARVMGPRPEAWDGSGGWGWVMLERDRQGDGAEAQAIALGGAALIACRSGVLVWPAESTLIVADLHLEKGSAFARRGQMLPPYDTRATLARLAAAIDRHRPRRVIALGDSFHDAEGPARLGDDEMGMLSDMQRGRTWVWISGNHDPDADPRLGGEAAAALVVAGVSLQHEPDPGCDRPQIVGHLHPAARLVWAAPRSAPAASPVTTAASCCRPSAPTPAVSTCCRRPSGRCSSPGRRLGSTCSAAPASIACRLPRWPGIERASAEPRPFAVVLSSIAREGDQQWPM